MSRILNLNKGVWKYFEMCNVYTHRLLMEDSSAFYKINRKMNLFNALITIEFILSAMLSSCFINHETFRYYVGEMKITDGNLQANFNMGMVLILSSHLSFLLHCKRVDVFQRQLIWIRSFELDRNMLRHEWGFNDSILKSFEK